MDDSAAFDLDLFFNAGVVWCGVVCSVIGGVVRSAYCVCVCVCVCAIDHAMAHGTKLMVVVPYLLST